MATQRMTAQEWATQYNLKSGMSAKRFWLIIGLTLVAGLALGLYMVPPGVVPGTLDQRGGLTAAKARSDARGPVGLP